MATTATTPNELYEAIDSTLRNQTVPNSITPTTHSDLLYNIIEVLSASTMTTGATLVGETIYFNRVDSLSAFTLNLSTIDSSSLPLSGGTLTGGLTGETLNLQSIGTGTSVNSLGIDSSGNVITTPTYKSYVALLNQTGTTAPVATVLYNTLGSDVTFTYQQVGDYVFSSTAFTENKTTVFIGQSYDSNGYAINYAYMTAYPDGSIFTALDNVGANDYLYNTPIEIRVYN